MNVLLINPPTPDFIDNKEYYIPSSLLYLASVLRKNNSDVRILDLNTKKTTSDNYEKIILHDIYNTNTSLVGITCLFSGQFPDVLNYSKKIKELFKNLPIVIGGIHPTLFPRQILSNCPSIDYIIIGEGEESIVHLTNIINKHNDNNKHSDENEHDYNNKYNVDTSFNKINGFAYRATNNNKKEIVINPKTTFINSLDDISMPSYDLINIHDYYHETTATWHNPRKLSINCSVPIITSRSCPMRCTFCSMYNVMGCKYRMRTPKNVVDEIEHLYIKYNQSHFSFMDDNLTFDKNHIIEICNKIIDRNLIIQFETPNGVSTKALDDETLDMLVAAGLVRLTLAIESGSDYIRNIIMKKMLPRNKIYEIVKLTKKYKTLYVRAFFIMGMPEDTQETLNDTYNMIREIDVDKPIVSNLIPFPGTSVYEQCIKDNLFVNNVNPDDLWKTKNLYFTNNKQFFIKPYQLELEELTEFRNKFDILINELMNKKITKSHSQNCGGKV